LAKRGEGRFSEEYLFSIMNSLVIPHPEPNHSGQRNKDETGQPDPEEFTLKHRPSPGTEERFYAHRRNLDWRPGEEIPLRQEGREESDPASPVCQGIEEAMACPDEKEEEKIAKPATRKEFLVPEEENH